MKSPSSRSRLLFLSLSFFLINYAFAQQTCNGSLSFDNSTNTSVRLPTNNQYYTGNNKGFTWECWFKLNTKPGSTNDDRQLISSIDSVNYEDIVLGFGWHGGVKNRGYDSLIFKVDGPSPTAPPDLNCAWAPPGGFVVGQWYHAAGVIDYSLGRKWLYVDGILRDVQAVTVSPIKRDIRTTLSSCNTCGSANSMDGYMDEVRIWARPLSGTEISTFMNQCRYGTEANFVAYYRCNQVGALSVIDATSNTNIGWFLNPPTPGWSTQNAPVSGPACDDACKCLGSLVFDNSTLDVQLPLNNQYYDTTNGGYTWECWFKMNQAIGSFDRPLISAVDSWQYEDMYLGFGWHGGVKNRGYDSLVFKVDGPGTIIAPPDPNCAWAPASGFIIGQWYHACGVADYASGIKTLYVNGQPVNSQVLTVHGNPRQIQTNLSECDDCTPSNTNYSNMDEVRIWNRVLSATEVLAYYDKCRAGTESDFVVYYRCNQVGAPLVIDGTGNVNTGIFVPSPSPGWSNENAPVYGPCQKDCNDDDYPQDPPKGKATGIGALSNSNGGLKIYPNPSSGSIKVSSEQPGVLTVYSVTGQVLSEIQVQKSEHEVKLEGYKPGIYLYVFTSGSSKISGKLIIEN